MTTPDNLPTAALRYTLADRCRSIGWYYPSALLLLLIAAGLRFYNLGENTIYFDEAQASFYTRGSFSELIDATQSPNTSALIYLLILFLVQQVEISTLSIRVVPAIASVLTVVAILFLLPRMGVSRPAALLAALLTTLSTAAIEYAQYAREYSLDTLMAVLLIAGLLWYRQKGRKILLAAALFLSPLVQFGLVLFGTAALVTVLLAGRSRDTAAIPQPLPKEPSSGLAWLWDWLKSRLELAGPAALFLAGCLISYLVTVRYQWQTGGFGNVSGDRFLTGYYYSGGYDPISVLSFAAARFWLAWNYHLPALVAILALAAIVTLLLSAAKRRRRDTIPLLFIISVIVAVGFALLKLYPLGGNRHALYLGPIIFLTGGIAFHWVAGQLADLARRPRLKPALLTGLAALTALTGIAAIRQDNPWRDWSNLKAVIAVLNEQAAAGDIVCVSPWETLPVKFYQGEPANYRYRCSAGRIAAQGGLPGVLNTAADDVLWLVSGRPRRTDRLWETVRADGQSKIEQVIYGAPHLYRVSRPGSAELLEEYRLTRGQQPAADADFDLYLDFDLFRNKSRLRYLKEPCAPADTAGRFFLQIIPAEVADLPRRQRDRGVDHQDFGFARYGDRFDGKCMATVPLPDYPIAAIRTGQLSPGQEPVWEAEFPADTVQLGQAIYQSIAAGEPAARADFDLYIRDNYLHYLKEPCRRADTAAPFFLHLVPDDVNDLPSWRRLYGFANRDFDFALRGGIQGGRCRAAVPLPEYGIAEIRTGQYAGGGRIWETAFEVER